MRKSRSSINTSYGLAHHLQTVLKMSVPLSDIIDKTGANSYCSPEVTMQMN